MRLAIGLGLTLGLLYAACSGGDDPTPSPSPDFDTVAAAVVSDALLTLDDLPAGWEETAPDDELTADVDLSSQCDIFSAAVAFPGAVATDESVIFGGGLGQQVASFAAIFRAEDAADSAVTGTQDIFDRCEDEFRDAVEQAARAELEALGIDLSIFADIEVDLGELEMPSVGDSSAAYRMEVRVGIVGADQRFTLDVLAIRSGRVVGAMTYAVFGEPNAEDEREIAATLAENLAEVDGQLPE